MKILDSQLKEVSVYESEQRIKILEIYMRKYIQTMIICIAVSIPIKNV